VAADPDFSVRRSARARRVRVGVTTEGGIEVVLSQLVDRPRG
jgi:hypothetical protein